MAGKGRIRSIACAACKKKKKGCPHNKPAPPAVAPPSTRPVLAPAPPARQIHPLSSGPWTRQDEPQTPLPSLRARPSATPAKRNAPSLLVRLPISVQFSDGRAEILAGQTPQPVSFLPSPPHQSPAWQMEIDTPRQAAGKGRASLFTPTYLQHEQQLQQKPLQHKQQLQQKPLQHISSSLQAFDFTKQQPTAAEAHTNRGDAMSMPHQTPTSDDISRQQDGVEAAQVMMPTMNSAAPGQSQATFSPLPVLSVQKSQDMIMTDAPAFTYAPDPPRRIHRPRSTPRVRIAALQETTPESTPVISSVQALVRPANHVYEALPKFAQNVSPLQEPPRSMDINFDAWLEARRDSIVEVAGMFQIESLAHQNNLSSPATELEDTSANLKDFSSKWLPQLNKYINNWNSTANPSEVLKGYNLLKSFGEDAKLSRIKARDFPATDLPDEMLDHKVNKHTNVSAAAARAHELNRRSVQMWKQVRQGRRAVEGQTVAHLGARRLQEVDLLLKMDGEGRKQLQEVKRGHARSMFST